MPLTSYTDTNLEVIKINVKNRLFATITILATIAI